MPEPSRRAWRPSRAVLRTVSLALGIALLAGCGQTRRPAATLPRDPPTIVVKMVEYRLIYPSVIPAGRVVFRVVNYGRVMHQLTLVPLPRGMPPINVQLHGRKRRLVTPLAGVPDLPPGQADSFAVDLTAGQRYGVVCFDTVPGGPSDALRGMASEFRPVRPA